MNLPIPADPQERQAAAMRLLEAYLLLRSRYNFAGDLECELDEAVAGHALYTDDDRSELPRNR